MKNRQTDRLLLQLVSTRLDRSSATTVVVVVVVHWKLALLVCCLHSSLEVGKKMRGGTLCKKLTVKLGEERKRSERQMKTLAACLEIAHGKRHTRSTLDNLPENSNQTEHQCRLLLSLLRLLFAFFFFYCSFFVCTLWCSPATR